MSAKKAKALFLDRDGVLNDLIWNPKTEAYESPHDCASLKMISNSYPLLRKASELGFHLFVISNQPSYAKGKTTLEEIRWIAADLDQHLKRAGIHIHNYFYCYHHPDGIIPEFSGPCNCRKPKPFFILEAERNFALELEHSWMIGDQDSDVQCGQNAGCRTVLIANPHSAAKRGIMKPTFIANDLADALNLIFNMEGGIK